MSRHVGVGLSDEHDGCLAQVLESFVDAVALIGRPHQSPHAPCPGGGEKSSRPAVEISWGLAEKLESKLLQLSKLRMDSGTVTGTAVQTGGAFFGVAYRTVDALVRLIDVCRQVCPVEGGSGVEYGDCGRLSNTKQVAAVRATAVDSAVIRMVDLALVSLSNLLECPSWRHLFFRVLHYTQLEQQRRKESFCAEHGASSPARRVRGSLTTLQDFLWRKIVADSPELSPGPLTIRAAAGELDEPREQGRDPGTDCAGELRASAHLVSPVNHAAVRLTCHMVRHCPLSFPASSYASLAPHLSEYLLLDTTAGNETARGAERNRCRAAGGGDGSDGVFRRTTGSGGNVQGGGGMSRRVGDLVVLIDLFASCARGSPHFRQYVKGSRRKKELFRCLLGLLNSSGRGLLGAGSDVESEKIVVRALSALTRVLAGDALEGKIFERNNALETGSLVTDSLLKLARQSDNGCNSLSALGEQRRFAEVASDLARSPIFSSVLLQTGRLESFLHAAVIAITRAAEEIDLLEAGALECNGTMGTAQRTLGGSDGVMTPPEALLRALTSFCLEHSPARSAFVEALLSSNSPERRNGNTRASAPGRPEGAAACIRIRRGNSDSGGDGDHREIGFEPLTAIFVLCLHPHLPTATAASALLQCLLVGGGALGAVSGPSPGAAAGVGVIPAAYFTVGAIGGGVGTGGSIGREDPLQGKLLERINIVAIGGRRAGACGNRKPRSFSGKENFATTGNISENQGSLDRNTNNDSPNGRKGEKERSPCASSDSDFDEDEDEDESIAGDELLRCGLAAEVARLTLNNNRNTSPGGLGLSAATVTACGRGDPRISPSLSPPRAAVEFILRRLAKTGSDLAAAWAKEQRASGAVGGAGIGAAEGNKRVTFAGSGGREGRGYGAREPTLFLGCSVEVEQNVTSLLCLLSSLALASPASACALARAAVPLESALAPILSAQRSALRGLNPADYPRAPVEIVLVALTLIAQLALALNHRCHDGSKSQSAGVEVQRGEWKMGWQGASTIQGESGGRSAERGRRSWRRDVARAARLRTFLGEQAASAEVKLCMGYAACRAESKDLARRVASLISLLQAGGGADALLVADALYAFAQSAEAQESDLKARAAAAEALACRERAMGERRALALSEAEGLVRQIEARNAEERSRLSKDETAARQRLEEAQARAIARERQALRRAEETAADLERMIRTKEESLRSAGRETRAKDLEIASLRGDLAGEQRLKIAAEAKLSEACSERDEVARAKAEVELVLEATTADLGEARGECRAVSTALEEERVNAARGWGAARKAEDALERTNARAEEAYGKLILLARGYKSLEDEMRLKATETDAELAGVIAKAKLSEDKAREEERLHRQTKAALRDTEAALQRTEERLMKVSAEAVEAQAATAAAHAAGRDAMDKASVASREAKAKGDEAKRLTAELERCREACARKDLEISQKTKELGQQAGIIGYINKLSSNVAAAEAEAGAKTSANNAAAEGGSVH